jgi:hypothetical protein
MLERRGMKDVRIENAPWFGPIRGLPAGTAHRGSLKAY